MTWYRTVKTKSGREELAELGQNEDEAKKVLEDARQNVQANRTGNPNTMITIAGSIVISPRDVETISIHEAI